MKKKSKRRSPGNGLRSAYRIKKLNAFKAAVVNETDSVVYLCRDKICSSLGLPLDSTQVRLDRDKLIRAAFGEHRNIVIVYPLERALQAKHCGQKQLVYFTCAECDQFSTLVYWRLKLRPLTTKPSCTKCFRQNSSACVETVKKWQAARWRSARDVCKQNKPPTKPSFTISDSFRALIERTYCQPKSQ